MDPFILDGKKIEDIQNAIHRLVEKYEPSVEELSSACARVIHGHGAIKGMSKGMEIAEELAAKKELAGAGKK